MVDDEALEEQGVLLVDRPVEPEVVLDARDVLGGRRLAGRQARRVGRQEEEEDVGDHRHADEEHARPRAVGG